MPFFSATIGKLINRGNKQADDGSGVTSSAVPSNATLVSGRQSQRTKEVEPPQPPTPKVKTLPAVIRYHGTDAKQRLAAGQSLSVVIDRTSAGPQDPATSVFPLSPSEGNYFSILELPAGEVVFRFVTDDNTYLIDGTQPTINISNATVANTLVLNVDQLMQTKDDDDAIDEASGWGQEATTFEETRKFPPLLPPHLRFTPLNTPPTQVRCAVDGKYSTEVKPLDAEHLPLPLSVTINHIYLQRREDHTVTGITTRYRDKYTTIVYYRPKEIGGSDAARNANASA